jgi:hypothetical protein
MNNNLGEGWRGKDSEAGELENGATTILGRGLRNRG